MIDVYLETGAKRVFACAVDWPGLARSGRDADSALEALEQYRARYLGVVALADEGAPTGALRVVATVAGDGTTDFGAPNVVPDLDRSSVTPAAAARLAALVEACWSALDAVVARAPESLRRGPRGGGRDRDEVFRHVTAAEAAYARKLGVRHKEPKDATAVSALRADLAVALATPDPTSAWPLPYAARRIGWHVLDHAWEIEDKSV